MSTYTQRHRDYYLQNKERILSLRAERERKYLATPAGKYSVQKHKAKQRKIGWEFTFESWWKMWEDSGKWEERGDESGKYCMARHGDEGPYSVENVTISLVEDNCRDNYLKHKFQRT